MADFCRQCTTDLFGEDVINDFAGMTTKEDEKQGRFALVLCERCGPIQVNTVGGCISSDCFKNHRKISLSED